MLTTQHSEIFLVALTQAGVNASTLCNNHFNKQFKNFYFEDEKYSFFNDI